LLTIFVSYIAKFLQRRRYYFDTNYLFVHTKNHEITV